MTRENLTVGYPAHTVTASGGSWDADWPLANLLTLPLSKVARTDDATTSSAQMTLSLSAPRLVSAVALCRHNFTVDAQVRVTLKDSAGSTLATTGWAMVYGPVYEAFSLPWGHPSFMSLRADTGLIDERTVAYAAVFDAAELTTSVFVEIDDTSNPDSYISIGYVAVSDLLEFEYNPDYGFQEGLIVRSEVQESEGGVTHIERRPSKRFIGGQALMTTVSRRTLFEPWFRERDLDRPFLVILEPGTTLNDDQTVWLGRHGEVSPADRAFYGVDRQAFRLEQVL